MRRTITLRTLPPVTRTTDRKDFTRAIKFDDFSAYGDLARRAFEPAAQLGETVAGSIERLARFQYELAGDFLQLGIEQMQATVRAKDLGALVTRQSEIASKFLEQATQRQQGLAKIATDSQAGLARWAEQASMAGWQDP